MLPTRATLLIRLPAFAALVLALVLALVTAACAPPLQNGEIVVFSGAAERLGMLCRWRRDAAQGDLCPQLEASEPSPTASQPNPSPSR